MSGQSVTAVPRQFAKTIEVCAPTVVEAALGRLTREACDARLARWAAHAIRLADAEVVSEGLEHVLPERSYLLMSNHQSAYDIFSLFVAFPHSLRMVAKESIFRMPIMGGGMKAAGFVPIDRGNHARAMAALEHAKEVMASGINVWIAPEGTRSDDGRLLPFKRGGFMMAIQLGCPILPVSIVGARDVLPAKDFTVQKGKRVHLTFHPPIEASEYTVETRDELRDRVKAQIESVLPY